MEKQHEPFPLFKGATRLPMIMGVPLIPLMVVVITIAAIAMLFNLWCWFLVLPAWFIMAQVTKHDDKAFRIWELWIDTKWKNSNKSFWKASSYSKVDYRKRNKR